MNNWKLPCPVVRDLLPSYAEKLTEEETSAAVKAHLEGCPDCQARYKAMTADVPAAPDAKEVDFLKTVRKRNRWKMLLAFMLAVVLMLGGIACKVFWIGSPCHTGPGGVSTSVYVNEEQSVLHVKVMTFNSGEAIRPVRIQRRDGLVQITARKVLVSPFCRSGEAKAVVPLDGVTQVEFLGDIIFQDGMVVDYPTMALWEARTPYVGNASAVSSLLNAFGLPAHSIALQTDREPFGLTIHFEDTLSPNRRARMEHDAVLLLALIGNLEEVHWDDPTGFASGLTLEQADAVLPRLVEAWNDVNGTQWVMDSTKDAAASLVSLQKLMNMIHMPEQ